MFYYGRDPKTRFKLVEEARVTYDLLVLYRVPYHTFISVYDAPYPDADTFHRR